MCEFLENKFSINFVICIVIKINEYANANILTFINIHFFDSVVIFSNFWSVTVEESDFFFLMILCSSRSIAQTLETTNYHSKTRRIGGIQ